jgi:predicted RNA binding protein YcfA (HicA-like mRNA interferase family)
MGRLAGISGLHAARAFCRAGYVIVRQRGSHITLARPGFLNLTIPAHKSVSPFLLRAQIRRAGLTEEQFLALL